MQKNMIPVIVTFIFLVVIGVYVLGSKNKKILTQNTIIATTPTSTIMSPSPTVLSPSQQVTMSPVRTIQTRQMQVADDFYSWYLSCLKTNCDYKTSDNIDKIELPNNIESKFVGGNPIICGQNPPQSFSVKGTNATQENQSTVYVVESFGSGATEQIAVDLKLENDSWKITNISCPGI